MGRSLLLVWAVLSTGVLFAKPNRILMNDINPGSKSINPGNKFKLNDKPNFLTSVTKWCLQIKPLRYIQLPHGSLGALPLTWIDITAIIQNGSTLFRWITARENNNEHFVIERSATGTAYNSIGNKNPDRSIIDSKNYPLNDYAHKGGTNYNPVKQVYNDGKFSYSRVAMVNLKTKMGIHNSPNPSTDFIMISMNANLNPATMRIFDAGGKLVFNKTRFALNPTRISVYHPPRGWYVVETQRKNEKHSKTFLNNRVFHTTAALSRVALI